MPYGNKLASLSIIILCDDFGFVKIIKQFEIQKYVKVKNHPPINTSIRIISTTPPSNA